MKQEVSKLRSTKLEEKAKELEKEGKGEEAQLVHNMIARKKKTEKEMQD